MGNKQVVINVDPNTRPLVPTIVVFPEEYVEFKSIGGKSTFFFPEGDQIFEDRGDPPSRVVFSVGGEKVPVSLQINPEIFQSPVGQRFDPLRGALFFEYAVFCTTEDGKTYFAQGNSAPRIIIPPATR